MHGPGGPRGGGHHGGPRGPRGGYGGPRGGFFGRPHGFYGGGHHRPHRGFYGRPRREKSYYRSAPSDGSMWKEFKSTMSYSLKKHSVFGLVTGLASFFVINPVFDMQYTYRKHALEYSKNKGRITEEQFNSRMIRLEESNAAQMYRNGLIDQEDYDKMMDAFEEQYKVEKVKSK